MRGLTNLTSETLLRIIQDFLNDRITKEVGTNMGTSAVDEALALHSKGKGKGEGRQGYQARTPAGEHAGRKGAPAERVPLPKGVNVASVKPDAAMNVAV